MATGNLTAPVLFALQSDCGPALQDLIDSEFIEENDLQQAIQLTHAGGGVAAAKRLAREEADMVCSCTHVFLLKRRRACLFWGIACYLAQLRLSSIVRFLTVQCARQMC